MATKTVVVVQPSYLPWRGYFDLIRRSDVFVFYDDVQYDKHGWRNRNRIKTPHGPRWLTIPVHARGNTRDHRAINEIKIVTTSQWQRAHKEQLRHAYAKAPHYNRYKELIDELYSTQSTFLADFTIASTIRLAQALGITHTSFVRSSQFEVSGSKTERLVSLLRHLGATHYISGPAAREYIEPKRFHDARIALEYIDYKYAEYEQLYPPYDAAVSILDLLFMKGPESPEYIKPLTAACECTV